MRRLIQTTAFCFALATPVSAEIIYEGRDAQKLHCAAMLGVVAGALHHMNAMPDRLYNESVLLAAMILEQLPGTEAEKNRRFVSAGIRLSTPAVPSSLSLNSKKSHRGARESFGARELRLPQ